MQLPLVLDGATGTMLQRLGMPPGVCSEQWVLQHPDVLQQMQKDYAAAGSDIVYAPTFGANRVKLARYGLENQVAEFNHRLVELSRKAVGTNVMVAADLAPTGQFVPPIGDLPFEKMVEVYTEQAAALEEAGVDLYVVETTMTLPEARAAVLAIRSVSTKPIFVTFTVDEHGRSLTGTDVLAALVTMEAMGADAFGLNCSTGPEAMLVQLRRLGEHTALPLIAKPNAGLPETVNGETVYHCPPAAFTALTGEMARCGVRIFGGCCGTTPEHIAALRRSVDDLGLTGTSASRPGGIAVATEKDAWFFDTVDVDDCVDVLCGEDLLDDLMDAAEEDETFIRLKLEDADGLEFFEESQYAVRKPLILDTDDAGVLERALRLYQGVALYRDQGSIEKATLARLSATYGVKII